MSEKRKSHVLNDNDVVHPMCLRCKNKKGCQLKYNGNPNIKHNAVPEKCRANKAFNMNPKQQFKEIEK